MGGKKHSRMHKMKALFFKKTPLAKLIKKKQHKNNNLGIKEAITAESVNIQRIMNNIIPMLKTLELEKFPKYNLPQLIQ